MFVVKEHAGVDSPPQGQGGDLLQHVQQHAVCSRCNTGAGSEGGPGVPLPAITVWGGCDPNKSLTFPQYDGQLSPRLGAHFAIAAATRYHVNFQPRGFDSAMIYCPYVVKPYFKKEVKQLLLPISRVFWTIVQS